MPRSRMHRDRYGTDFSAPSPARTAQEPTLRISQVLAIQTSPFPSPEDETSDDTSNCNISSNISNNISNNSSSSNVQSVGGGGGGGGSSDGRRRRGAELAGGGSQSLLRKSFSREVSFGSRRRRRRRRSSESDSPFADGSGSAYFGKSLDLSIDLIGGSQSHLDTKPAARASSPPVNPFGRPLPTALTHRFSDDQISDRLTGPTAPISSIVSDSHDQDDPFDSKRTDTKRLHRKGGIASFVRRRSSIASAASSNKSTTPRNTLSSAADKALGLALDQQHHKTQQQQIPSHFDWLAPNLSAQNLQHHQQQPTSQPQPPFYIPIHDSAKSLTKQLQNKQRHTSHSPTRPSRRSLASEADAALAKQTQRRVRQAAVAASAATAAAITANAKAAKLTATTTTTLLPADLLTAPLPANTSAAPSATRPRVASLQRTWSKASSITNSAATDPSAGIHSAVMEDAVKARAVIRRQSRLAFAAEFLDSALRESTSLTSSRAGPAFIPPPTRSASHDNIDTSIEPSAPVLDIAPPSATPASDTDPVQRAQMAQRERLWSRSGAVIRNMGVVLEGSASSASHNIDIPFDNNQDNTNNHSLEDDGTFDDIGIAARNLRNTRMTEEQSRVWMGVETLLAEAFSESSASSFSQLHHRQSVISSSSSHSSSSSKAADLLDNALRAYVQRERDSQTLSTHRSAQSRRSEEWHPLSETLGTSTKRSEDDSDSDGNHDKYHVQEIDTSNEAENEEYQDSPSQYIPINELSAPQIAYDPNETGVAYAALDSFASFFAPDLSGRSSTASSLTSSGVRRRAPSPVPETTNLAINLQPRDDIASSISEAISSMEILRSSLQALMTKERRMQRRAAKAAATARATSLATTSIFEEDEGPEQEVTQVNTGQRNDDNNNDRMMYETDEIGRDDIEINKGLAIDAMNAMVDMLLGAEEEQSTIKSRQSSTQAEPTPDTDTAVTLLSEEDVQRKAAMLTGARKTLFDLFHWSLRVNIDEQERQRGRKKRQRRRQRKQDNQSAAVKEPKGEEGAQGNQTRKKTKITMATTSSSRPRQSISSIATGQLAIIADEESNSDDSDESNSVQSAFATTSLPQDAPVDTNLEATTKVTSAILKGPTSFIGDDDEEDDDAALDISSTEFKGFNPLINPVPSTTQDTRDRHTSSIDSSSEPLNLEHDDRAKILEDIARIGSRYGVRLSDDSTVSSSPSFSRFGRLAESESMSSATGREMTTSRRQSEIQSISSVLTIAESAVPEEHPSRTLSNASVRVGTPDNTNELNKEGGTDNKNESHDAESGSLSHFSPVNWQPNVNKSSIDGDDSKDSKDDDNGDDHHDKGNDDKDESLIAEEESFPSDDSIVEVTLIGDTAILDSVSDGSVDSMSYRKAPLPLSALKKAFTGPLDSPSVSSLVSSQQLTHHPGMTNAPLIRPAASSVRVNRVDAPPDTDPNQRQFASAPYDTHIASLVGSALDLLTTVTTGSDGSPDSLAALRDRIPAPAAFELAFAVTQPSSSKKRSTKVRPEDLTVSVKTDSILPQEINLDSLIDGNQEENEESKQPEEALVPISPSTTWDSSNGGGKVSWASSPSPASKASIMARFNQSFTFSAIRQERRDGNGGRVFERTVSFRSVSSKSSSDSSKKVDQKGVEKGSSPSGRPTLYDTGLSFTLRSVTRTSATKGETSKGKGSEEIQATSINLEVIESLQPSVQDDKTANNNTAATVLATDQTNTAPSNQNLPMQPDMAEKYSSARFRFVPVLDEEASSATCRPRRARFRNPPKASGRTNSVWKGKWFVIGRTRRSSPSPSSSSSTTTPSQPASSTRRPDMKRGLSQHALLENNENDETTDIFQGVLSFGFGLITEPTETADQMSLLSSREREQSNTTSTVSMTTA